MTTQPCDRGTAVANAHSKSEQYDAAKGMNLCVAPVCQVQLPIMLQRCAATDWRNKSRHLNMHMGLGDGHGFRAAWTLRTDDAAVRGVMMGSKQTSQASEPLSDVHVSHEHDSTLTSRFRTSTYRNLPSSSSAAWTRIACQPEANECSVRQSPCSLRFHETRASPSALNQNLWRGNMQLRSNEGTKE